MYRAKTNCIFDLSVELFQQLFWKIKLAVVDVAMPLKVMVTQSNITCAGKMLFDVGYFGRQYCLKLQ